VTLRLGITLPADRPPVIVATVLVLYTYDNGYPTMPLGVYLDVDAAPQYPEPWREIPSGWGGRGGYTTTHHDGRALELVRFPVLA
jgi:hypothetical protein